MILYLTKWFPTSERARATALLMTATAIAGVISGPVSGALLTMHGMAGISVRKENLAGGIAIINSIGNLGEFIGPYIVGLIKDNTGGFTGSLLFLSLALLMGSLIAFFMRTSPCR